MEQPPETQNGSRPLYLRIRDRLSEMIVAGVHPVGSLLPTEAELAAEFTASRFTVREALRTLQEEGWIERRQGVGSRVLTQTPTHRLSLSATSLEDLFQLGAGTCYVLLDEAAVTLDEALAEVTGGAPGEPWHRIEGIRWTAPGGTPICFIQSWFPARFAALVPRMEAHDGPLFALLEAEAGHPVEEAVQEISARPMPDRIARLLGQRPGTIALVLLRRYVTSGGVLIASCNWHPADQMTHVMRIRRAGAGASGSVSVDLS